MVDSSPEALKFWAELELGDLDKHEFPFMFTEEHGEVSCSNVRESQIK